MEDSKISLDNNNNNNKEGSSGQNRLQDSSVNNIMSITDEMGIGSNDSFLIARSLSPKEGTGMFGKQLA